MTQAGTADICVIFPLFDPRGKFSDALRTWTQGQTLSRGRYRVIVVSSGVSPESEADVSPLLGSSDRLVRTAADDGAGTAMALWSAGAAAAGTRWLIFVEAHCYADRGCLAAVARWIDDAPNAEVGNIAITHLCSNMLARISAQWIEEMLMRWRSSGEWPRLHDTAFAIRADVFKSAGGLEHDVGLFALPLLGGRLHASGNRIDYIAGAVVAHVEEHRVTAHRDCRGYAQGELLARSRNDLAFFDRYFGHSPLWTNQLRDRPAAARRLARAAIAAVWANPRRTGELAAGLRPLAAALVAGTRLGAAALAIATLLDEFAIRWLPMPAHWMRTIFERVHARNVRLAQLRWMMGQPFPAPQAGGFGRWSVAQLGPDTIAGVHGLEDYRGQRLRWTEPIALLCIGTGEGDCRLRIETGGLRGRVLPEVIAVVAGGRALPRDQMSETADGALTIHLTDGWSASARDGLVLFCSPLRPEHHGSTDRRMLGLPIVSVSCLPPQAASTSRVAD